MKIRDLFSDKPEQIIQKNSKTEKAREAEENDSSVAGEDRVSISNTARQFSLISKVVADDEKDQQQRIADLKERIESGSYNVSMTSVAEKMLSFAREADSE